MGGCREDSESAPAGRAPHPRRSPRPGRASVRVPPRSTTSPFTTTCSIPTANTLPSSPLNALTRGSASLQVPDEVIARRAGGLRFRAGTDDGIDALVAAVAVGDGSPCVVLTTDPDDLGRLLSEHPQVAVRAV